MIMMMIINGFEVGLTLPKDVLLNVTYLYMVCGRVELPKVEVLRFKISCSGFSFLQAFSYFKH